MVRSKTVLDRRLRKINSKLINFEFPSFLRVFKRRNAIANFWFLKGKSWALAYALNKVDHDKRGDHYERKKTQ